MNVSIALLSYSVILMLQTPLPNFPKPHHALKARVQFYFTKHCEAWCHGGL